MTDTCTIGPVSILDAHLFDANTFEFSNSATRVVSSGSTITTKGQFSESYKFEVICSYDEALQLKGLVEQGELVWMNTSDLTDNNYLQHKGWVLLIGLSIELENPTTLAKCAIEYLKISDHEAEYLTMDYSRGFYDGINLVPTYDITTTSYDLQDDGSDITTNWSVIQEYPTTATTSAATDGAEFDLATASGTDGRYATGWIRCDTMKFYPPFTFETVLDRNALPGAGAYPANIRVMFSPNLIMSGDIEYVNKKLGDYLEVSWNLYNTSTNMHVVNLSPSTGKSGIIKWMKTGINLGTAFAECGLKIEFQADGNIRVYTDLDTTGTWTQQYYGPSNIINYNNGFWIYLEVANTDSTSFTGSFHKAEVYNADDIAFPNIVCLPYNSTVSTTATGNRTGSDGNIPYYTDPSTELRFLSATADLYKGSVKLLSTNNTAAASRQVLGTDIKLTPTTTTLQNAFTQLTFDADEVIIKGWDGGAWNAINTIHFTADIDFIRPLFVNPDRVVLQINDTKWTMLRSSPIVTVEHPNTVLEYTLRDRYVTGSGTTSAPGAAADIAMTADTDYYMKIHDNASDSYSLVIGKRDPTTIKSDSLPADNITGIGWFKKAAAGINAADSLIQQWYKQTRTGISLKQII
jgi:hypothetical protein